MKIKHIEGATRVIGESQGYLGLPVRDETIACSVNGEGTPCMVTAWEPSQLEIECMRNGAPVLLRVLGTQHPPVQVGVDCPPAVQGRRFWPSEYVDEILPGGTDTPEEWIIGHCAQGWIIGSPAEDERIDYPCFIVQPGDEVEFSWHEPRGRDTLTFHPDGTWTLEKGEPEDWNHVFDLSDFLNSGDSLDRLVKDNIEMAGLRAGDGPLTIDVSFSKWGDTSFRLEVVGKTATFIPILETGKDI